MTRKTSVWTAAWWLDRGVVLVAALIAGGAALYSSYDALERLAVWAGWAKDAAPGLPLTVDVIALAAGIRYVRLHPDAEGRALAFKGVTWSAVVSVIGNAIVHAGLTPGWGIMHRVIAVGVSAVPAIGIAYVVHLVAAPVVRQLAEDEEREERPAPAPIIPGRVPPIPAPITPGVVPPTPVPAPVAPSDVEDDVEEPTPLFTSPPRARRHARPVGVPREGSIKARGLLLMQEAIEETGNPLTTNDLVSALGCTPRHAQNIVNEWKAS